jgi:PrtD family type I secretion system ABC transporter
MFQRIKDALHRKEASLRSGHGPASQQSGDTLRLPGTLPSELAAEFQHSRWVLLCVGMLSGVINLLALTGSLYMLQVYDRVIPSRSIPTLIGFSVIMIAFFTAFGLLVLVRERIMERLSLRIDRVLRERVFKAVLMLRLRAKANAGGMQPVRDLDQVRTYMTSGGPTALFDLPWMPLYIIMIYLLHPWLGHLTVIGALVLGTLAIAVEFRSRGPTQQAMASMAARQNFADAGRRNAEAIEAMGMGGQLAAQWSELSKSYLWHQTKAVSAGSGLGTLSKVLRLILQSAVLGLGALLVIMGEASAGVIIAASIATARALAPVESAIANWRGFVGARQAKERLTRLLSNLPDDAAVVGLPRPTKSLIVQGLSVAPPGERHPIIQNISFRLEAGAGLGVIGMSGCGKSTLARALVGVWLPLPQRGTIRLDGATLDQYANEFLGRDIGYLPQDIELFEGTVSENIARFATAKTADTVIKAAKLAGVHETILGLENGYETRIGEDGAKLSGGERQRVGIARALYADPFLVVLDEPNSSLDGKGEVALTDAIRAVRARGGICVVIAHRRSALAALDHVLEIANGQIRAFGPKNDVLKQLMKGPGAELPDASAPNSPTGKKINSDIVPDGS